MAPLWKATLLVFLAATVCAQSNYPNQYGTQPQYGNNRNDQFGDTNRNDQYGNNRNDQYGNRNDQYGNNRNDQFGNNPPQYGNQPNDNRQSFNNQQFGNQPFGNQQQSFGNQPFGNQFGNQPVGNLPGDGNCCDEYCYVQDEEPYNQFATKTAYESLSIKTNSQHIVPDCTPVQFWSLVRQGTSYPDYSRIQALRNLKRLHEEIIKNHEERRSFPEKGRLCTQDYDLFKKWHWNESITEDKANSLAPQGIEELKLLARRYKSKYSQILQSAYDERTYYFQYTNMDKTHDSYQAYIEGLFGSESYKVHANILNDEMLNRPYENCKNWPAQNDRNYDRNYDRNFQNQNTQMEFDRFVNKPEYVQMVRDVFRKLGFKYALNASVIQDIYDLCRYEKAWYVQQRSPWCVAFTKNQLKMIEYGEDLKEFYKSGYGNKDSKKVGCGVLKDLYDRFEKTVNGMSDGNKGTFHFTHSDSFLAFLTTLGLAQDYQALSSENYNQQSRRQWKTSLIDPFSANLAAALYQCRGNERYKVMFFLNEVPVDFPECRVGLCDWVTVQHKFERIVNECNVDAFCNSAPCHGFSYYLIVLLSVIFYFRL